MDKTAESIKRRWDQLDKQWTPHQKLYEDISKYLAPRRQWLKPSKGMLYDSIYDSSALEAIDRCSAVLSSLLCPDGIGWVDLESQDLAIRENKGMNEWIDARVGEMLDYLRSCKFYPHIDEFFLDLVPFCTSIIFTVKGRTQPLVYETIPINECRFSENEEGEVDTLFRKYKMAARKMVLKFGPDLPEEIMEAYSKEPDKEFELIWATEPRTKFLKGISKLDKRNLPVKTEFMEVSTGKMIYEGGYHEFPFAVCRLRRATGEIQGTGMGHVALPNAKSLNAMAGINLRIGRRIAQPPWDVVANSYVSTLDPGPDRINIRQRSGEKAEPLNLAGDIVFSTEQQKMMADAMNRIFLIAELQIPEKSRMTAEEVITARERATAFIGPSMGRIDIEGIFPVVERSFKILYRFGREKIPGEAKIFPDPPLGEMEVENLRIKMRSPLTRSQSYVELQSVSRALEMSMPVIQLDPSTRHWIAADTIMKDIFKITSCPSKYLNDKATVDKLREADRQAQERQEALETIERAGNAIKNPEELKKLLKMLGASLGGQK